MWRGAVGAERRGARIVHVSPRVWLVTSHRQTCVSRPSPKPPPETATRFSNARSSWACAQVYVAEKEFTYIRAYMSKHASINIHRQKQYIHTHKGIESKKFLIIISASSLKGKRVKMTGRRGAKRAGERKAGEGREERGRGAGLTRWRRAPLSNSPRPRPLSTKQTRIIHPFSHRLLPPPTHPRLIASLPPSSSRALSSRETKEEGGREGRGMIIIHLIFRRMESAMRCNIARAVQRLGDKWVTRVEG